MRVFDNPNHPHYGPVRRTWVILAGLGVESERYDDAYARRHDTWWDSCMAGGLDEGLEEQQLKRLIVRRFLTIQQVMTPERIER